MGKGAALACELKADQLKLKAGQLIKLESIQCILGLNLYLERVKKALFAWSKVDLALMFCQVLIQSISSVCSLYSDNIQDRPLIHIHSERKSLNTHRNV